MSSIKHSNSDALDSELVTLFKSENNMDAFSLLLSRYQPLILSRIRHFGFPKNDVEDLTQECMIGLYSAVISYEPAKSSFRTFSQLCIDRMLISVMRSRNRGHAVPEEALVDFNEESYLPEVNNNPELLLERFDNFEILLYKVKNVLSAFEYSVLLQTFSGMSYSEISTKLGVTVKAIDNAVQRTRRKFSKI